MVFLWARNDISQEWQAKARQEQMERWPDERIVFLNPKHFRTPEIETHQLTRQTALTVVPEGTERGVGVIIACPEAEVIVEGYRIAAEFLGKSIEIVTVSEPTEG